MTKHAECPNDKRWLRPNSSSFVIPSSFVFRHSSFAAFAPRRIFSSLTIQFTKRTDGAAVLKCIRDDGSVTWQRVDDKQAAFFPLHDLTHYAVEMELGYRQGFFGLIAEGWDIDETTGKSARGRLPDEALEVEHFVSSFTAEWNSHANWSAADFNEQAVAFAKMKRLPEPRSLSEQELKEVRARFGELAARWRDLPEGETLRLEFPLL